LQQSLVKMMAAMSNGEPIRDLRISGDYRHGGPQGMMADYQVNEIMAGFYANANVRRDSFNTHQPVKMEPQAAQVIAEPRREQAIMSLDAIQFPSITLPPAPEGCVLPHLRDVVEPIIKEYNAQYMWAIQQQQQTMAFGTNPVGTYPSYVIAGPVPNAFPPQMNPYLAVNPQQAIANPASKSPPTSSAPSQPFINQYAQPTQGMGIPSGVAQYAAQMGQNGQPPVNWAEFIPSNQVSSMNGNHSHKSEDIHKSPAPKSTNGHVNKEAHTEPKSSSSAHSPVNDKKSAFSPKLKSNELEEQAKQALFAMADQVLEFERSTESRKRRTPETPVESNVTKRQKVSPVPITAHRF
jgi:hypothetical protein